MGYGFVQFFKASCVDKALKLLQHKMLDGHCLELKRSNRASTADDVKTAKKESKEQSSEQVNFEKLTILTYNMVTLFFYCRPDCP